MNFSSTMQAAARHLVIGLHATTLSDEERNFLAQYRPAGVIFFSRNLSGGLTQLKTLIAHIRECSEDATSLWIDQEGGRVQRLKEPLTILPSAARFAALDRIDSEKAQKLTRMAGHLAGREIASLGIRINCAPVLDLLEVGASSIIGDRSFGDTTEQVVRLAGAWMDGLLSAGVMGMGKHFPGHGAAKVDSHLALPTVDKKRSELKRHELSTFKSLLAKLPAIMTAHLVATALDPDHPATFSRNILIDLLRNKWNFPGLVVADALEMHALSGSMHERAGKAAIAGCDLLLCCTGRMQDSMDALAGIDAAQNHAPQQLTMSKQRIEQILRTFHPTDWTFESLICDPGYRHNRDIIENIGHGDTPMAVDVTDYIIGNQRSS